MRLPAIAISFVSAAVILVPQCAPAADNDAGVSLAPADAAGPWTLESDGRPICVVRLGAEKLSAGGFALRVPATCGDALPAGLTGWTPTAHGMSLVDANGQSSIAFGRWSDSLLVSRRSSGVDVQLQRGGPNP